MKRYILPLLIIISIVLTGCGSDNPEMPSEKAPKLQITNMPSTVTEEMQGNFVQAANTVQRSVVSISVKQVVISNSLFFGKQTNVVRASASGIVISEDGYILTNEHVVKDMDAIKVILPTGEELQAQLIGTDPLTDLSVIKVIPPRKLSPAKLGDSNNVKVGEWAMAIGNSLGLEESVTVGIISAVHRDVIPPESPQGYRDFIQTDASINPGNSGGPLINIEGEVIGVNDFIATTSGGSIGIGFAIPINTAKYVIEQLIAHGKVVRGWLGIGAQELSPRMAAFFGVPSGQGVLVEYVAPNGPADKAGLKVGDIIERVENHNVKSVVELQEIVAKAQVGEKINVVINRNGEKSIMKVTVGKRADGNNEEGMKPLVHFNLGLTVRNITPYIAQKLGLQDREGVVVVDVQQGSCADDEGIKVGDVIKEINHVKIKNLDDYNRQIAKIASGEDILFLIQRDGYTHYVVISNGERIEKAPSKPLIYL